MKEHKTANTWLWLYGGNLLAAVLGGGLLAVAPLYAAESAQTMAQQSVEAGEPSAPAGASTSASTELMPNVELFLGQSYLIKLPKKMAVLEKVSVDKPNVVEVAVPNLREVVLHAREVGSAVVVLKSKSGDSSVVNVTVVDSSMGKNANALQKKLQQLMPGETGIRVGTAASTIVMTGTVSDVVKVDKAMMIAEAYGGKNNVINMLDVSAPQQVMLEVKMAEVSKNILDKLGAQLNGVTTPDGGPTYALASGFLSLTGANPASPGGLLSIIKGNNAIKIDAENKDGVVKILAEPNIMAISGQEGSFLAGGKIFIPVAQPAGSGTSAITLEEKEFGVGLKFTPTVLEDGLINLRVAPEVSELSQSGIEVTATSGSSVLPSFVTRRVSTTVQLRDGQSFAIAGLIQNNVTETIRRFPFLGDIPILGALFRSSEFQHDKSELLFVVTPHLVRPLAPQHALPTDNFTPPSRKEFFLDGKLEGKSDKSDAAPVEPEKPAKQQPTKQQPSAAEPAPQSDSSGNEVK